MSLVETGNSLNELLHSIFNITEVKIAAATAISDGVVGVIVEQNQHGNLYSDLEWGLMLLRYIVYGAGAFGVFRGLFNWVKSLKK